jgi:UDP-2,3-diacylglucosamine pyrophosphatase LpxH
MSAMYAAMEGANQSMWNVEELFILSDLHLAAERGVGLFQADAELADCLCWILKEARDSVIVLAGDVLDFLVLSAGSPITAFDGLGERTREIIECHSEVFEALAGLAQSSRHRLIMMGGNHDPELIFPAVQEEIERRLGMSFINPTIRWLVHGEALRVRVGNAIVLIEHGNALDPWNRIDHAALQIAFSLASRNFSDASDYQPPPGSSLVLEVMNELRDRYHWIDCLKPETESVLPLLQHFASPSQQRLIFNLADNYLSMKTFALNKKIDNSRNPERLYKGEKEAEDSPKDRAFNEWVGAVYEQQRLTPGNKRTADRLIGKLRLVSAQDAFFESDKPDGTILYLKPIFEGGADLVVHGHTHSAKAYPVESGFYLNTGTWGQLLRLPKSDESEGVWQGFLDRLRTNDVESFRRPTFARIRHLQEKNVTSAALLEWQNRGAKTLAARRFLDRRTGWQKES